MEGWLAKRGPTSDYRWARRWCVLSRESLEYFEDDRRQLKKGSIGLKRATTAAAFQGKAQGRNAQAPGEASRHWQERPFGFVLDVDPAAGLRRHLYYFDCGSPDALEAWTGAFERLARGEAPAPAAAPAAALAAARGSVLRALQGAASRRCVAEAAVSEASRRASSTLVGSLLARCCQEKDVPIERRRMSAAQSESKRCSKAGFGGLGTIREQERSNSQATVLAPTTRQSLMPSDDATDLDDKVAYIRASQSNIRGFFPVGRSSTLQLQLCPEVCGEASDSESESSEEEQEADEPRARKMRNPAKAKALSDVERNAAVFKDLPAELRADKELALAAVRGDPDMLAFASEALRSDREVVLASVQRDGRALRHSVLQADRDVVMAAALQNADAMKYADEGLRKDDSLLVF